MHEESEKELLRKIQQTLEEIKAVLTLTNQDKLDEMKKNLLKEGSIESQVYELCDGVNTTQDIANKIKKSAEYAAAVLSTLRRKGLVRTIERDNKKVHEQRF